MVIHKLDEKRALHLEDRVCDFIPEFGRYAWSPSTRCYWEIDLTLGLPILGPHVARLVQRMVEIGRAFPKVCGSGTGRRRFLDRTPSSRSSGSG